MNVFTAVRASIKFGMAFRDAGYSHEQLDQVTAVLRASDPTDTDPVVKSADYMPGKSGWMFNGKTGEFEVNPIATVA